MQRLWYSFLRRYVKIGLRIYFEQIIVTGSENIPKGPVIFAANHQNAFLDALLIVCFNPKFTHFLTRADIFKRPFVKWLLSTMNMIPVFRIRDGWESLSENQKTFDACYQLFLKKEAVVIFPEGNHGSQRRIRPLSKGFAKIAFDSLKKDPSLEISVVPVGLNFSDHSAFKSSVHIIYGKAYSAKDFFNEPLQQEANRFRNELADRLKQLTTHIEEEGSYDGIITKLDRTQPDYLHPEEVNRRINKIENHETVLSVAKESKRRSGIFAPLQNLALLINFIPILIWQKIKARIKDPVFIGSMRLGVGIFLFPAFYLLVAAGLWLIFGGLVATGWLIVAVLTISFLKN